MNLSQGVKEYVLRRRTDGITFHSGMQILMSFQKAVGEMSLSDLTVAHAVMFLDASIVNNGTWRGKHRQLDKFFEFWSARGAMTRLLMPPLKPKVRNLFVPYVYTRLELRGLLKAVRKNDSPRGAIDRQCLRSLLLFIYGTGATLGETLSLQLADVDLKAGLIRLRGQRSGRIRKIPIGTDLQEVLRTYSVWRNRLGYASANYFVARRDRCITASMMTVNFARLRQIAGVSRTDGGKYQPRLCDLRVTFAVHRITSWIKNKADLNRMLPALAAYMGQNGLGQTGEYMALAPERFRKELNRLSPGRREKHWRDDKILMKFLATL